MIKRTYCGPIKILQGKEALVDIESPIRVKAQFDDLNLPYEYTHDWKVFSVEDFQIGKAWIPPWPRTVVGCVSLVFLGNRIVAIECGKGRGLTLPGGKLEPGESFAECAKRELYEETYLHAVKQKLIFVGPDCDGIVSYTFLMEVRESSVASYNNDGEAIKLVDWSDLKNSYYHGYYEILEELIG